MKFTRFLVPAFTWPGLHATWKDRLLSMALVGTLTGWGLYIITNFT